jgi:hypothetical protein
MSKLVRKFDSVEQYTTEAATNLGLSIVTIPIAADFLGLQVSTVRQYLRSGKLLEVDIQGENQMWSTVGLQSLLDFKRERDSSINSLVSLIERKLIHQAKVVRATAPYDSFMEPFGLNHESSKDRELLGKVLGTISEKTWEKQEILLSVMAVRKNGGMPNDAFFSLARRLGVMSANENPEQFFRKQVRRVIAAYR